MTKLFTYEQPPIWKDDAVATPQGWSDPVTGENLVAIRNLSTVAGNANITEIFFTDEEFVVDTVGAIQLKVRFNEKVNVSAGATIVITSDGTPTTITATASAQTNVNEVLFVATSPDDEGAELSIAPQTISGTIVDNLGNAASNKVINSTIANAVVPAVLVAE